MGVPGRVLEDLGGVPIFVIPTRGKEKNSFSFFMTLGLFLGTENLILKNWGVLGGSWRTWGGGVSQILSSPHIAKKFISFFYDPGGVP